MLILNVCGIHLTNISLKHLNLIQKNYIQTAKININLILIHCYHAHELVDASNIVVRAFAHGAMGHRIDPSWWTH